MTKRYFPEKVNVITSTDDAGITLDIDRIPGEKLFNFKKRLLESSSLVANSSYNGLINGINRELGLEQLEVINLKFKPILNGDISDPLTVHNNFIISDSRLYQGIIDGALTRIENNKFRSHEHLWLNDYLVGLTLILGSEEFIIVSNTYNELTLDRAPLSPYLNQTYTIKPKWKTNAYIGFVLILEKERYIVLANSENTITLNKPITYRENGFFSLSLARPRVQITASRILFFIEYLSEKNYRLEFELNLRENQITHRELCKKVNAESKYFQMEDLIPLEYPVKAFTLKQKDSDIKVFEEDIPASKFFKLANKNIKADTLKFSESDIFSKEEDELNDTLSGPYYTVNHNEGVIKSSLLPSGQGQISYTYMDFPLTIESAPVVVLGLSDKETEKFLFSQKEKIIYDDYRNRFVSSQPKTEMIEYISELLKINRQSWGV